MSLANPTSVIVLERQIDGTNANTWNDRYNANFARIDQAIGGTVQVDVTGGSATLTTVDSSDLNADAQQRAFLIQAVGTPSAATTVILPAAIPTKPYFFANSTAWPCTFKVAGGTGVTAQPSDQIAVASGGDIEQTFNCMGTVRSNLAGALFGLPFSTPDPIAAQAYGTAILPATIKTWTDGYSNACMNFGVAPGGTSFQLFYQGASFVGAIGMSGSTLQLQSVSDYRLKSVRGLTDAGPMIDAVPVHDAAFLASPDLPHRPMFLAHELQARAPWAVQGEKDATNEDGTVKAQTVSHADLVPALWAEVRALRQRVAALEACG